MITKPRETEQQKECRTAAYMPTPEQIAAECALIQAEKRAAREADEKREDERWRGEDACQ